MTPKISIITPAFNAERYLSETIRSVTAQTMAGWEMIIVDDGSTDGTAAVAQGFAQTDARIRYVFQDNGGQASARNTGIRQARADWIAFLDADDLWMPDKLQRQLQAADETGASLIYTGGYIFSDGRVEDSSYFYPSVPGRWQGADLVARLYRRNFIGNLSVLASRAALAAVNGLDEARSIQNGEDYDLWLRLAALGKTFYGISDALFRYRRHTASATGNEVALLRAELVVLVKNANLPGLNPTARLQRLRSAYRSLVAALLREERWDEARELLDDLARRWDSHGKVTRFQQAVIHRAPGRFNQIMTPLYRAGGLVNTLSARIIRRTDDPRGDKIPPRVEALEQRR